jgi:hypothetical protein
LTNLRLQAPRVALQVRRTPEHSVLTFFSSHLSASHPSFLPFNVVNASPLLAETKSKPNPAPMPVRSFTAPSVSASFRAPSVRAPSLPPFVPSAPAGHSAMSPPSIGRASSVGHGGVVGGGVNLRSRGASSFLSRSREQAIDPHFLAQPHSLSLHLVLVWLPLTQTCRWPALVKRKEANVRLFSPEYLHLVRYAS